MKNHELINAPLIMFPVGTEVLIKGKIVGLKALDDRFVENVVKLAYGEQIIAPNDAIYVKDEPEVGHADEAPRYVKNILARLRELPVHDREVWLKAIIGEFEQDFSRAKWREGYEQGKVEGMIERQKVVVPQFVADWYEENKDDFEFNVWDYAYMFGNKEESDFKEWFNNSETKSFQTLVNMHQFGYEVEKEKRYIIKLKGVPDGAKFLKYAKVIQEWYFGAEEHSSDREIRHTRKQLEEAGFGWMFDCKGIEVEEVEE